MYLQSLKISNFRKFGTEENEIMFAKGCHTDSIITPAENSAENEIKINIAPQTTLVVGKNNSGKTTIIDALDILINKNGMFNADDFNFKYLTLLLEKYENNSGVVNELPQLEFDLKVAFDDNLDRDILSELYQILTISNIKNKECEIKIVYRVAENVEFKEKIEKLISNKSIDDKSLKFDKFKKIIDETNFEIKYFNSDKEEVEKFRISNLIELKYIKANNIREENCLSSAFSKIVEYKYNNYIEENNDDESNNDDLDKNIDEINRKLSEYMKKQHSDNLNKILKEVISKDKCKILLKSNLTVKNLLNTVIKYYFEEESKEIPENHFGLGYTNFIMIIAEILQYMEQYPISSFNSKVNLIAIEEPETFMHPQMQELFIDKINNMIQALLDLKHKNINSQIIITTHSTHILNSKIHNGESFSNINYVKEENMQAKVIVLDDSKISELSNNDLKEYESIRLDEKQSELDEKEQKFLNFEFIKKHIVFKISEIFFADAVIFVEGICEYNLLQYYIKKYDKLSKQYISIVNIDGSHAKMYLKLIDVLGIPTLIVTDIDIKREKKEKGEMYESPEKKKVVGEYVQMTSLANRESTNETLKYFMELKSIVKIEDYKYYENKNLMVVFQQKIGDIYPTSFEEAFILTNKENSKLIETLENLKPNIFKQMQDENLRFEDTSFKWQCKLKNDKSRFANKVLYAELINKGNENLLCLPQYIVDGLNFLENKLEN